MRAAGPAVLAVLVAGLVTACGGGSGDEGGEVFSPPSAEGTASSTEETAASSDTGALPPGARDCGRITPSGWPTTALPSPEVLSCLVDALATGAPAFLVEVSYAAHGAPGAADPAYRHQITYEVVGPGALRVTTDWTGVPGAPAGVVAEVCRGLAGSLWPEPTGCAPA